MKLTRIVCIGAVLLGAAVAAPFVVGMGLLNGLVLMLVAALYAMGYNLLWGQAGLISFGHSTYFAFGGFAAITAMTAIDNGLALPTPLVPLVAALASFALGVVAGWFATIRTGVAFAMITVAITEMVAAIVDRWDAVFGGEAGIESVRTDWGPVAVQSLAGVYYFTLAWTLLGILFLWMLQRSPVGTVIRGLREQEERVRFLGYNTHALKTVVFAISAGISGLAGGLLAFANESTNVALFDGSYSAAVLVNAVIGGARVFLGPVVGAFLATLFGYYVANWTLYWLLYMGILFIAIVAFAPSGITGLMLDAMRRVLAGGPLPIGQILRRITGMLGLSLAIILTVELVGAVVAPSYAARAVASHVAWPVVLVLGVQWWPSSPLTLAVIAGLYGLAATCLSDMPFSGRAWIVGKAPTLGEGPTP